MTLLSWTSMAAPPLRLPLVLCLPPPQRRRRTTRTTSSSSTTMSRRTVWARVLERVQVRVRVLGRVQVQARERALVRGQGHFTADLPAVQAALDVVAQTDLDGLDLDPERYSRRIIERVLTQYESLGVEFNDDDLEYLLARVSQLPTISRMVH